MAALVKMSIVRPFGKHFAVDKLNKLTCRQTSGMSGVKDNPIQTNTKINHNTVDEDEVSKFDRLAQSWWDESGEMAALHTMNRLRVPFVSESLTKNIKKTDEQSIVSPSESCTKPLLGLKILDVGCGAGILSEPLARLGASVTGLDASVENIEMAKQHASTDPDLPSITYHCLPVEDFCQDEPQLFNCVIASEIVEHVSDASVFLEACGKLVRPGGSIFVTTLNKTAISFLFGKVAAEYIMRIVPAGAHDWNKFISPQDVQDILLQNGFETREVRGMTMNPLSMKWYWIENQSINYALHATKHGN